MPDPDRFAIVPIPSDTSGAEVKFPTAIMTGSMSAVMARIKDSKQMMADLRVSNQADQVRRAKAELAAREVAIAEREDNLAAHEEDIAALINKLDTLATRVDQFEEQQRAEAEAEEAAELSVAEFALPPGSPVDEDEPELHTDAGDLQATKPPMDEAQLAAIEEDEEDPGPVPLSYGKTPTSYVKGESDEGDLPRELTEKVPVPTGTETEFPGPRQSTARAPVGTSW